MRLTLAAVALLAVAAVAGGAARAERLILRDGSSIETGGPWRVEGRQVLFSLPGGALSSLRLEDVDLEASEEWAARHAAPTPDPAAAKPRAAVMVITDDDVPRARRPEPPAPADDPEPEAAADTGAADGEVLFAAEGLEVASWRSLDSPRGGVEITGVLVNRGEHLVADASISLRATNVDGDDATYSAILNNPTLRPGQRSPFRILLPDVFAVDDTVEFDVEGRALRPRVAGFGAESEGEDDPSASVTEDGGGGQR